MEETYAYGSSADQDVTRPQRRIVKVKSHKRSSITMSDVQLIMQSTIDLHEEKNLAEMVEVTDQVGLVYIADSKTSELRAVVLSPKIYGQMQAQS